MNVSLTPKLEAFIKTKVRSGDYNNASEVMREALRLLLDRDAVNKRKLERLRRSIDLADASTDAVDFSFKKLKVQIAKDARARR